MLSLRASLSFLFAFVALSLASAQEPTRAPKLWIAMDDPPGNIAITPEGRVFVSLHQFFNPANTVVEVMPDGSTSPFPDAAWNKHEPGNGTTLDTVLGIRADKNGVVWMLDNGMRRKSVPKLVAWDTRADELVLMSHVPPHLYPDDAFLNDLAVDVDRGFVYVADPAGGANAALLIFDRATKEWRRVLEGHESVVPDESLDLVIDGKPVQMKKPDGTVVTPHIGVNPIALDQDGSWLYFGPMHGAKMYRIRTAELRNAALSDEDLGAKVEVYSSKPICDGIDVDFHGRIVVSDIANNGVGVIGNDTKYRLVVSGPELSWPDAFAWHPDGRLIVVANQLHRTPALNGGVDAVKRPFGLYEADIAMRAVTAPAP